MVDKTDWEEGKIYRRVDNNEHIVILKIRSIGDKLVSAYYINLSTGKEISGAFTRDGLWQKQ